MVKPLKSGQQGSEAKSRLLAYLQMTPGHGGALFLLCRAEMLCGDYVAAENALRQILTNEQNTQMIISTLMRLLIAKIGAVDLPGFKRIELQLEEVTCKPENETVFEKTSRLLAKSGIFLEDSIPTLTH